MLMKKIECNEITFDNDKIVLSVCNDLVASSTIFHDLEKFCDWKKLFDVALIPAWHHIYTGMLKTLWYRFLKPCDSLFLIIEWDDSNKVVLLNRFDNPVMWKFWDQNSWFFDDFDFVSCVEWDFSQYYGELSYPRIVDDYENLYILRVGKKVSKKNLIALMKRCCSVWNVVFVSDLHSNLPLSECEKQDKNIMIDPLVEKCKNPYIVYLFCLLAGQFDAKILQLWYNNTAYFDWNKKNTTWFGCFVF